MISRPTSTVSARQRSVACALPAWPDALPALRPEQALQWLCARGWERADLELAWPLLHGRLAECDSASQRQCYQILLQADPRQLAAFRPGLLAALALLAAELNLWQLAADWYAQLLQARLRPAARINLTFNLGVACIHTGAYRQAEQCLRDAQDDAAPARPCAADRLQELLAYRAQCETRIGAPSLRLPPYAPSVARSDGIAITATLLAAHHAPALYRQQRDALLAQAAGVERLASIAHGEAWIANQPQTGARLALLHPVFGLVGIAAFDPAHPAGGESTGPAAHFYCWIGAGYQGRGYGTQALSLLRMAAAHQGIARLFSMIDERNLGSVRSVEKLGGRRLDSILPGMPLRCAFYHYGSRASAATLHQELAALQERRQQPGRGGAR